MNSIFNITAFGAAPDQANNAPAIQKAVDSCNAAGGGVVHCPPGTFRTGSFRLKSNVNLHLESGCTLLGSPRREDYCEDNGVPESEAFPREKVSEAHLIMAYRAENVSISGRGTIDGNGTAFVPLTGHKWDRSKYEWRPGQMVYFCRCRDVRVEGVKLYNPSYWTLFLHACEDVKVRGLEIKNPFESPNGDGLDIDCCRNVTVSDCVIYSGDDSITLRGNTRPLGNNAFPCENIVIQNCILSSPCNAIRVGVGAGEIRNCTFSNIVIRESRIGINLISRYSDTGDITTSVTIRNLRFSNMFIEANVPLMVTTGKGGDSEVENIAFSNLTLSQKNTCYFGGTTENPLRNISLTDIDCVLGGGGDNLPADYTTLERYPEGRMITNGLPVAMLFWDAEGININGLRILRGEIDGKWEQALCLRNCSRARLNHIDVEGGIFQDESATLECADSSDVSLHGCSGLEASATQRE